MNQPKKIRRSMSYRKPNGSDDVFESMDTDGSKITQSD